MEIWEQPVKASGEFWCFVFLPEADAPWNVILDTTQNILMLAWAGIIFPSRELSGLFLPCFLVNFLPILGFILTFLWICVELSNHGMAIWVPVEILSSAVDFLIYFFFFLEKLIPQPLTKNESNPKYQKIQLQVR